MMSNLELQLCVLREKVVQTTQKLHYNIAISKEKHQAAVERAELFAGDFMAYLNQPEVWAKLNLDHSQNEVLNALTEAAKTGNLHNRRTEGLYDGFPVLRQGFSDYDDFNKILV